MLSANGNSRSSLFLDLSAKVEYALLALMELANHWHRKTPLTINEITARQPIPDRYLEHIFTILRRGGLVQSQRGAKGGYVLTREPWKITVLDVVMLIEGDRTFVHPLHYYHNTDQHYALSNGYLVEMSYFEELLPLEEMQNVELRNLEWRIALPAETHRQKVLKVEPIGLPFTEEVQNGQRVAVFKFDSLKYHERHLFGWRATLELRGIKYLFQPGNVEKLPPLPAQYQTTYLIDDDDLAMHTPVIREAARVAIGSETNLLRKMLSIRNYVYDRLSYRIKPHIDTPDIALQRGTGSCGEYVGVLLALTRLNGIACRTVGRYKCPQKPDLRHIPLEPDFNHVWLEFYIPGYGWLPMESNPDDIMEQGPYPTRFFMGLPWYHAEIGKGIPFEKIQAENKPEELSIGDIALNHIRFTILDELPPPATRADVRN